jgi:hypothetical protein
LVAPPCLDSHTLNLSGELDLSPISEYLDEVRAMPWSPYALPRLRRHALSDDLGFDSFQHEPEISISQRDETAHKEKTKMRAIKMVHSPSCCLHHFNVDNKHCSVALSRHFNFATFHEPYITVYYTRTPLGETVNPNSLSGSSSILYPLGSSRALGLLSMEYSRVTNITAY